MTKKSAIARRRTGPAPTPARRPNSRGFNPEDFLRLAERLAKNPDEASRRSAISRAYYSVFLIARNLLRLNNVSEGVHRKIQRQMADLGYTSIANALYKLRKLRNAADYITSHPVDAHGAHACVTDARTCCQALSRIHVPRPSAAAPTVMQRGQAVVSTAMGTQRHHPEASR